MPRFLSTQTFTVVLLSFLCALLTTLSLSAVATNGRAVSAQERHAVRAVYHEQLEPSGLMEGRIL